MWPVCPASWPRGAGTTSLEHSQPTGTEYIQGIISSFSKTDKKYVLCIYIITDKMMVYKYRKKEVQVQRL